MTLIESYGTMAEKVSTVFGKLQTMINGRVQNIANWYTSLNKGQEKVMLRIKQNIEVREIVVLITLLIIYLLIFYLTRKEKKKVEKT